MFRLSKFTLLFSISLALLVALLFYSACNKDEDEFTREDFVDALKGEWYVLHFWRTPTFPAQVDYIQSSRVGDSLMYRYRDTTNYYPVNDPFVCTLPEIENMQSWTISGNADDLILSTIDLCGNTREYQVEYSNYRYVEGTNYYRIIADVEMIGPDTIWILDGFSFNDDYLQFTSWNDSLAIYDYVLDR
jgi:hypothetical protein